MAGNAKTNPHKSFTEHTHAHAHAHKQTNKYNQQANLSFHRFNCTYRLICTWLSQFNLFIWICEIIRAKNPPKMHLKREMYSCRSSTISNTELLHYFTLKLVWVMLMKYRTRRLANDEWKLLLYVVYDIANWIIYIVILTAHISLKL